MLRGNFEDMPLGFWLFVVPIALLIGGLYALRLHRSSNVPTEVPTGRYELRESISLVRKKQRLLIALAIPLVLMVCIPAIWLSVEAGIIGDRTKDPELTPIVYALFVLCGVVFAAFGWAIYRSTRGARLLMDDKLPLLVADESGIAFGTAVTGLPDNLFYTWSQLRSARFLIGGYYQLGGEVGAAFTFSPANGVKEDVNVSFEYVPVAETRKLKAKIHHHAPDSADLNLGVFSPVEETADLKAS